MKQQGFGQALSALEFAALKRGKQPGFQAAYGLYADAVYSLSMQLLRDEAAASDILQDVFETLLNRAGSLQSVDTLGGWLKTTTVNACMGHFRRQGRDSPGGGCVESISDGDILAGPDEADGDFSLGHQALRLLGRLPYMPRSVVYLYAVQGLKHTEIAPSLEINEVNSRQIYRRALGQLKTWLHQAGATDE